MVVSLAACEESPDADADAGATAGVHAGPAERPTEVPAASGLVTTSRPVTVSDDGTGPRLCFTPASLGDACSDARVSWWDWGLHEDVAEHRGIRSGTFELTGTFDGTTFYVTNTREPAEEPQEYDDPPIPCSEPPGGWRVRDPALTTRSTFWDIGPRAQELDGYAAVTISTPDGGPLLLDPRNVVVIVYVAGDAGVAEAELRKHWGGMLCVTEVERSHAELQRVTLRLLDLPGLVEVGSGNIENQVDLVVFHDDGRYQQWADDEFGDGVVAVTSVLQPAP